MSDVLGFPVNKVTDISCKNKLEKLSLKCWEMVRINFVKKLWNLLQFKEDANKQANVQRGAIGVLQPGTVQTFSF